MKKDTTNKEEQALQTLVRSYWWELLTKELLVWREDSIKELLVADSKKNKVEFTEHDVYRMNIQNIDLLLNKPETLIKCYKPL